MLLAVCVCLHGQTEQPAGTPVKEEIKGMPARTSPTDYQAHTQVGKLTIAAEFTGHSIATEDSPLTNDDYIVVETAFYGAAGERVKIGGSDFTLKINGKKELPVQPYGMVLANVKDPNYESPDAVAAKKSKTSLNGGDSASNDPPPIIHIPIEVQRAMALKVRKSALPEGERAVPVAGLIYFRYGGKVKGIHSIELTYSGSAGTATLNLQP